MRYIQRKKIKLDTGEELDIGSQILVAFVTPKLTGQKDPTSDYEQQRTVYKALRYLRKDTKCAIELNDYIALEDAWYEHLMHQMKNWPWGINDPAIFEMIQEMESAPDEEPKLKAIK